MEKLNYYDDDINMIWQSSPEKTGEALKKLSRTLASCNYEYEKANNEINNQLAKLGISSKEKLFDVLNELADIWIKASTTGYKEEGCWLGPGTSEETDKSNEKVIQKFLEKNSNLKFFLIPIHAQKLFLLGLL